MINQSEIDSYSLSEQVGFNLRRANQRHVAIFAKHVTVMTPTQFAAMAQLAQHGALSQNLLGRKTAMDSATIKGVVERLKRKGFVSQRPDPNDQRLRLVDLTEDGQLAYNNALPQALEARRETMKSLSDDEEQLFEALLSKIV